MQTVSINSDSIKGFINGAVRNLISATMIERRVNKANALKLVEDWIVSMLRAEGLNVLGREDIKLLYNASSKVYQGQNHKVVEQIFNSIKEYINEQDQSKGW